MFDECELLTQCGFFRKYMKTKTYACKGYIRTYCKGPKQPLCRRKEYLENTKKPPSDDMLPSGYMLPQEEAIL